MPAEHATMLAPHALEVPDPGFLLLASCLGLLVLQLFRAPVASIILLLIGATSVFLGKISFLAIGTSFLVGMLSDLTLNAYFRGRRALKARGAMLRQYFDQMGTFTAAVFAGAITVIMTEATLALAAVIGITGSPLGLCVAGLLAGAALGMPAQSSLALRELLPFYKSTTGPWENRAWDGVSQAWAMAWVQLTAAAAASNK